MNTPIVKYNAPELLIWTGMLSGLFAVSLYNYLLFHVLIEGVSIVVAVGIFMFAWNSKQFLDNNFLLLLGIAYLFIGFTDLLHTLTYKGMGIFSESNTNIPTQLWISARYMESLSIAAALFFRAERIRPVPIFMTYLLATTLLLFSMFYWHIFPDCYIEGSGLTLFKKNSEYLIAATLAAILFLLAKQRPEFDETIFKLIALSIFLTIISELAFTLYISVYGISNFVGHICRLLSVYLIYKAIIKQA